MSSLSILSYAQEKQATFYFKNNNQTVKTKDEADYYRVTAGPLDGSASFSFVEYFKNDIKKREGKASRLEPFILEGEVTAYYPNGKKKEVVSFKGGKRTGPASYYYQNGQLEKQVDVSIEPSNNPGSAAVEKEKLMAFFDSTGVQYVKDGNGYFKSPKMIDGRMEEGNYAGGEKEGVWKGTLAGGSYEEQYEKGVFISGIATWPDGQKHEYKEVNRFPEPQGGIREFYKFVGQTYKYPNEAKQKRVKGRVIIDFVVERDGSLTDITVTKDPGSGTGEEAIRVLQTSPKWNPGLQHGIPVRVKYTLPLNLSI